MKNIIVPVDFSEQSEFALQTAASLAKKYDAHILVVHMLELSDGIISSTDTLRSQQAVFLIKAVEKRFSEFLDKPFLKGFSITPIIKPYKVFSGLNEIAAEHGADLVVMGSHGSDGLKEIFVGSNAEKVVRYVDIPVLVVKEKHVDFKVKDFVFACDFKDENLGAFQKAKAFADLFNAKLHLVYINTPGEYFLSTSDSYNRINQFLQKACTDLEVSIHNDYGVIQGILNFSEGIKADAIGIPTHGRKGLSHFFLGSIGEDVANHSTLPVVTFKI
ncbi:MAG: universal stress protein [Flavobacteriales bacterium]|nr:MAG: universal stress protein [Flavobacteriales bacterium]